MDSSRGSILLLMLWAVAVLSAAAVAQGIRVSLQLKWVGRMAESRQCGYLAWAAAEIAGQELVLDDQPAWDAPKEPWGKVNADPTPFSSGWIRTRIRDEQSRIPLNSAPLDLLTRLPGFSLQAAEELVARRNAGKPIAHPGELLSLTGFHKEELPALTEWATVYGSGPVNLNTAPAQVLGFLGLSTSLADRIVAFTLGPDGEPGTQDDGIFPDSEQIIPLLEKQLGPLAPEDQTTVGNLISARLIGVRSSLFQVEAEGWVHPNGIHTRVLAVMERTGPKSLPLLRGWYEAGS